MATKQTIIWTALPNGWVADASTPTLRLSVFVSARLETNDGLPRPTLVQFPDLLQWTSKVQEMSFAVQFDAGTPSAAKRVGPDLEPALWTALVKPSSYVKPYEAPNQFGKRIIKRVFSIDRPQRIADYRTANGLATNTLVPADAVTASGSGCMAALDAERWLAARG